MEAAWFGLLLSMLAGLATMAGSVVVFFINTYTASMFAACMAFSAGVMTYISFVEMLPTGYAHLEKAYKNRNVDKLDFYISCRLVFAFFIGWVITIFLDMVVSACMESSTQDDDKRTSRPNSTSADTNCIHRHESLQEISALNISYKPLLIATSKGGPADLESQDISNKLASVNTLSHACVTQLHPVQHIAESETHHRSNNIHSTHEKHDPQSDMLGLSILGSMCPSARLSTQYSGSTEDKQAPSLKSADTKGNCWSSFRYQLLQKIGNLFKCNRQHSIYELEIMRLSQESFHVEQKKHRKLGFITAIALAIHNFPEGIATYTAGITNKQFGFGVAIAVGAHNIPEGLAVSIPILYGSGNRWKAFLYGAISGLAEPVGALLAHLLSQGSISDEVIGWMICVISGIMTSVGLRELYIDALRYDPTNKCTTLWFFIAMVCISLTILALKFSGM